MTGPIIVGVDGSPTARKAAEKARYLAATLKAPLHVVSAYAEDRTEVVSSGSDQWVVSDADNARYIAETVTKSLDTSDVEVLPRSVRGKPAEALIGYAEQINAEMIVVGNQRMRGVRRVLGSVANSVSHNATCDVYIANTHTD